MNRISGIPRASFNPCFSGSCYRIRGGDGCRYCFYIVSILVLVDLAIEYIMGTGSESVYSVSILVLVDLAIEWDIPSRRCARRPGFNPCFSGSCYRILCRSTYSSLFFRFNPCFSGSCYRILSQATPAAASV